MVECSEPALGLPQLHRLLGTAQVTALEERPAPERARGREEHLPPVRLRANGLSHVCQRLGNSPQEVQRESTAVAGRGDRHHRSSRPRLAKRGVQHDQVELELVDGRESAGERVDDIAVATLLGQENAVRPGTFGERTNPGGRRAREATDECKLGEQRSLGSSVLRTRLPDQPFYPFHGVGKEGRLELCRAQIAGLELGRQLGVAPLCVGGSQLERSRRLPVPPLRRQDAPQLQSDPRPRKRFAAECGADRNRSGASGSAASVSACPSSTSTSASTSRGGGSSSARRR